MKLQYGNISFEFLNLQIFECETAMPQIYSITYLQPAANILLYDYSFANSLVSLQYKYIFWKIRIKTSNIFTKMIMFRLIIWPTTKRKCYHHTYIHALWLKKYTEIQNVEKTASFVILNANRQSNFKEKNYIK